MSRNGSYEDLHLNRHNAYFKKRLLYEYLHKRFSFTILLILILFLWVNLWPNIRMYPQFTQMSGMEGWGAVFDFQLAPKWRQHLYQPSNKGFRNPFIKAPLLTFFFPHEIPITVKNNNIPFRCQAKFWRATGKAPSSGWLSSHVGYRLLNPIFMCSSRAKK